MDMRNIKRKNITIFLGGILVGGLIVGLGQTNLFNKPTSKENILAMYVQNDAGEYEKSTEKIFPTEGYVLNTEKSTCRNGGSISQDSNTKKLSVSVSNKEECTVYFDKEKSLSSRDILDYLNQSSNGMKTNFDDPALTDEGIFEMEDDYGTSYYYRGAVENNYVKYGVNEIGREMWWRIIRVNGDGSLRIVYDGTQGYVNGIENDDRFAKVWQQYNAKNNDAKYVGWMYGPAGTTASTSKEQAQSNIESVDAKKVVDQWYKENIVDTGYENNISDEIFCNDRSIPGKVQTGWSSDTEKGFGSNVTAYGAYARMKIGFNNTGLKPTFKCPQKNDAFTVSDTKKGNGALTYPVGLITADEIVAAGSGKNGTTNKQYYLYKSKGFFQWSLSPCYWLSGARMFVVGSVSSSGNLHYTDTNYTSAAIAPVINLSPEYAVTLKGTGTIADPYRAA